MMQIYGYDVSDDRIASTQDIQLLACRSMMADEPLIPMSVVEGEEPLEKTRLRGPFDVELIPWIMKMYAAGLLRMGRDADGRQYAEY